MLVGERRIAPMEIFSSAKDNLSPADAATFTGSARAQRLASPDLKPSFKVYQVDFDPSARTHWHRHTGPQLLVILSGVCRVQSEGSHAREAIAGDLVLIRPGEKHWHGATEEGPMTHLAINLDARTEWLEAVSDLTYTGGKD